MSKCYRIIEARRTVKCRLLVLILVKLCSPWQVPIQCYNKLFLGPYYGCISRSISRGFPALLTLQSMRYFELREATCRFIYAAEDIFALIVSHVYSAIWLVSDLSSINSAWPRGCHPKGLTMAEDFQDSGGRARNRLTRSLLQISSLPVQSPNY